jgi:hypothetical protein
MGQFIISILILLGKDGSIMKKNEEIGLKMIDIIDMICVD